MKWINVKKEKSNYYEPILVLCENGFQYTAYRVVNDDNNEAYTMLGNSEFDIENVTHWMPLPKKPE